MKSNIVFLVLVYPKIQVASAFNPLVPFPIRNCLFNLYWRSSNIICDRLGLQYEKTEPKVLVVELKESQRGVIWRLGRLKYKAVL